MDYPAIVHTSRPVTPSVPAAPIVCSEFRRGRGYAAWRPQGSDDWLLIVTRAGAGRVTLPRGDVLLEAGDAVLFAPGAPQDYSTDEATGHWHLRWAHFLPRPHWHPWLIWPEIAPKVGRLYVRESVGASINAALERMLTVSHLGGSHWEDLAMNALEEVLVWIFRLIANERLGSVDPRVQRAAHYLATHPNQSFQLSELAAQCGLSSSRFSHLFRAELGVTPQRFSEKLRLEAARQLLAQTNLTIAEVAAEVGYSDFFYFSRRFRRLFGRAPTAERLALLRSDPGESELPPLEHTLFSDLERRLTMRRRMASDADASK